MNRRALCLLSLVLLGFGATGAAVAAEQAGELAVSAQGHGKPVTLDLPLGKPGTDQSSPAVSPEDALNQRLAQLGMKLGSPIMIRIFKSEAELEVWMRAGERFELLATYAICNWSGTLGPKLSEGDKQSPEGLYGIGRRQVRYSRRWRRSLDIGYPNAFDRAHARTGSYILLHGGCTTTGCFAMTDQVMEQIFRLSHAALWNGQQRIEVHIFPFRMTPENMAAHADSPWHDFWANLKEAYDLFERTRVPPLVSVCNRRYVVRKAGDETSCPEEALSVQSTPPPAAPKKEPSAEAAPPSHPPGRNARRAYAEARKARLAARARAAGHRFKHPHIHPAGYRKLRR